MNDNDNPLKILITEFADAFAAWLLERPIQSVRPLNVEFPAQPVRSDLLFEVYDIYGGKLLLHFELQGRSSHKPMPYRELNYLSHTVIREIPLPLSLNSPRLHSVVLYVGEGAGRGTMAVTLSMAQVMSWPYIGNINPFVCGKFRQKTCYN